MAKRRVVDARGSFCPGPLMELIAAMKMAAVDEELEVLSTDKGSAHEIPEWIQKAKHEHIETLEVNGVWHVLVKKTH
jgi:tRNA 2-thiouridine synthesizing protein A